MAKPTKETPISKANEKAAEKKNKDACREGILDEAMKLERGEQHSIQQMLAYVRQLKKLSK